MAEQDDIGRYPQATPAGNAIPYEIIRPLGLIKVAIQTAPVIEVALPDVTSFLVLRATAACIIMLDGDVSAPTLNQYNSNYVFVDKDEVVVIDHNAASELSVVRAEDEDGILWVQVCETYKDIRKLAQLDRM